MKRNVEAIVWFLVGCVVCTTYILYMYSIHGVYTGRDPQIPEIPKKSGVPQVSVKCKSGFGLVVLLPCV